MKEAIPADAYDREVGSTEVVSNKPGIGQELAEVRWADAIGSERRTTWQGARSLESDLCG
jgi:hypothetical protein